VAIIALSNAPVVEDVQPMYGAASGNTVVTVSGRRLDRTPLRIVHYGNYTWSNNDTRYNTLNTLDLTKTHSDKKLMTILLILIIIILTKLSHFISHRSFLILSLLNTNNCHFKVICVRLNSFFFVASHY